jgi:hypothetical protein
MPRYFHHLRIAAIAAFASIAALALSAAPAGALACPPGITGGSYCTTSRPTDLTEPAIHIGATSATLDGEVDGFGDFTQYFFQYGKTSESRGVGGTRAYGHTTPTLTLPECPPGATTPAYCVNPSLAKLSDAAVAVSGVEEQVSAVTKGLTPDTKYHFRIVAMNANGKTYGPDKTFKTLNIISVVHTPGSVKHRKHFKVTVGLRTRATVTISLLQHNGHVVKKFPEGSRTGTFNQSITAPTKTGKYVIRVVAKADGVKQTVSRSITVS